MNTPNPTNDTLARLAQVIESRKPAHGGDPEKSYVARLLHKGPDAVLKKIGEEPTPAIRANLRRIDAVGWLNDNRLLTSLDESQQRAVIALVLFPLMGSDYALQSFSRMMILAIFAMSLDLLQGVTGLVSLGHAAYFGLAGYALAFISPETGPVNLWWSLPLSRIVGEVNLGCLQVSV